MTIDFQSFPKINLHHHLEGAVSPQTFLELGIQYNILPEYSTLVDILPLIQTDKPLANLIEYLERIDRAILITQAKQDLTRICREIIENAHANGVEYLELRGGPSIHVKEHLCLEDVFEGILEGIHQGEKNTGIKANFICCALRHESESQNMSLVKTAAKYKKYGVVGFDLAGDEFHYPAPMHQKIFEYAIDAGLGITVHAGEARNYESVEEAIQYLHPCRIGHGIASIHSEQTLELLKSKKILLEVCPTSNYHTGAVKSLKEHPIKKLFDNGILLSIGDDDPTTSNITINDEYNLLYDTYGFSLEQLYQIQMNSIDKAFISENEKESLKQRVQKKWRVV